jgi:hypothetical protein
VLDICTRPPGHACCCCLSTSATVASLLLLPYSPPHTRRERSGAALPFPLSYQRLAASVGVRYQSRGPCPAAARTEESRPLLRRRRAAAGRLLLADDADAASSSRQQERRPQATGFRRLQASATAAGFYRQILLRAPLLSGYYSQLARRLTRPRLLLLPAG